MAASLKQLVKQLEDSGIVAVGAIERSLPTNVDAQTPEQLTRVLVEQNHLTLCQAEQVDAGKASSLVLGSYTLLDKIGAGGMGQVFKAEHRRMKRVVALKMLPAAMTGDAAATARFQREVEAAAKLLHPNIVSAFDADQADGTHFLVMEYIDGIDLAALVKKHGPCTPAQALDYVLQAARGLEFAHKKGVVHRDIKPANLLIDNEGTVKILDMGLARLDDAPGSDAAPKADLTGTGTIMGTVDYMSPEQAYNTKLADGRADIYSLGCTLHYLLSGRSVYDGETVMERLLAHRERAIPSLSGPRSDVPQRLAAAFEKMVAKKTEDRYQSMTEVIAELERCAGAISNVTAHAAVEAPNTTILKSAGPARRHASPASPTNPAPKSFGNGGRGRNKMLLLGAAAGGFLALLWGVIVVIRNEKGDEVGRFELPPGHTAELQPSGATPKGEPKSTPGATPTGTHTTVPKTVAVPRGVAKLPKLKPTAPTKPITDVNSPAFQEWVKSTQALSVEAQIKEVSRKMVELNPGFDGKLTGLNNVSPPKIEDGAVTEVSMINDAVLDLTPIRVFSRLRSLVCNSYQNASGSLTDLSPLKGLSLEYLAIPGTNVSDLNPLKGMPLVRFNCVRTPVTDLSPLHGMKLAFVGFSETKVANLAPIANTELTDLVCNESDVSDLTPLLDCKALRNLNVAGSKVTPEGIAAFQLAMPSCKIIQEQATPAPSASEKK